MDTANRITARVDTPAFAACIDYVLAVVREGLIVISVCMNVEGMAAFAYLDGVTIDVYFDQEQSKGWPPGLSVYDGLVLHIDLPPNSSEMEVITCVNDDRRTRIVLAAPLDWSVPEIKVTTP